MEYEYKKTEEVMEMLTKDMSPKNVRNAISILPNEIKKMKKELNMCGNLMNTSADLSDENDPILMELRERHSNLQEWVQFSEEVLQSSNDLISTMEDKAQEIVSNLTN